MSRPWSADTRADVEASLAREQDPTIAKVLAAYMDGAGPDAQRRPDPRPRRVGHKPLPTHAIPMTKGRSGRTGAETIEVGNYLRERERRRKVLRRAVINYGDDSEQAKSAAADLAAWVRA